jgi:hypothetical protein
MDVEEERSKSKIVETDGLHTFHNLVKGRDYIVIEEGRRYRYIKYDFLLEDYPESLPVFRRVNDDLFEVPINAIPMKIFTFVEGDREENYIGSYEIFDVLAKIFAKVNKEGYKFNKLDLSSIALCPGEREWLQFIPSTFSLEESDSSIKDYSFLLDDLDKYDPQNNHEKLKSFFKSQYIKYLNES